MIFSKEILLCDLVVLAEETKAKGEEIKHRLILNIIDLIIKKQIGHQYELMEKLEKGGVNREEDNHNS